MTSASASTPLPEWKRSLITTALETGILSFGSFTLKSGRVSPYFVNCGLFCRSKPLRAIGQAYAQTLHAHALAHPEWSFDVLFGPAYKGIQLCALTAVQLGELDAGRWDGVGTSYNRKEAKDHGEGGIMVGESLRGKKVVVIDDVMTAGTAIREAISIIDAQGGTLVGVIVAIDRQEKMPSAAEKRGEKDDGSPRSSAIGEVARETGVPVLAVLTLDDLITGMATLGKEDEVRQMEEYRKQYGATD